MQLGALPCLDRRKTWPLAHPVRLAAWRPGSPALTPLVRRRREQCDGEHATSAHCSERLLSHRQQSAAAPSPGARLVALSCLAGRMQVHYDSGACPLGRRLPARLPSSVSPHAMLAGRSTVAARKTPTSHGHRRTSPRAGARPAPVPRGLKMPERCRLPNLNYIGTAARPRSSRAAKKETIIMLTRRSRGTQRHGGLVAFSSRASLALSFEWLR